MSVIIEKTIYESTEENLFQYGKHINLFRGIPAVDGLKPVFRRVLMSANDIGTGLKGTAEIVGYCMSHYHPHGDASIAPVVSQLVRRGLLTGEGNHGKDYIDSNEPAAMRYTKAGLSGNLSSFFFKYSAYAPHKYNETKGLQEPEYFITPVPISLMTGAAGIGLGGVVTRIPAFTLDSLIDAYLNNDPHKLVPAKNTLVDWDIEALWNYGRGKIVTTLNVKQEWSKDDQQTVTIITGPEGGIKPVLGELQRRLDLDHIWMRDESKREIRLVIGRAYRTRSINDDEILEMATRAARNSKHYMIMVNIFDEIRVIGIKEWLEITFTLFQRAINLWKEDRLKDISNKMEEFTYLPQVGERIVKEMTNEAIASELNIPIELVNKISNKSMKLLRRTDFENEIQHLQEQILAVNDTSIQTELSSIKSNIILK